MALLQVAAWQHHHQWLAGRALMGWLQSHRWQLTKQRAAQKGRQAVLLPTFQEWALHSLGMQKAQLHWVSTAAAVSEAKRKPVACAHTKAWQRM